MRQRHLRPRYNSELLPGFTPPPPPHIQQKELSNYEIEKNNEQNYPQSYKLLNDKIIIKQKNIKKINRSVGKLGTPQKTNQLPKLDNKRKIYFKLDIEGKISRKKYHYNNSFSVRQKNNHEKRNSYGGINNEVKSYNKVIKQLVSNAYSQTELNDQRINFDCQRKNKLSVINYIKKKIVANNHHNHQNQKNIYQSPLKILQTPKSKQISLTLKQKINIDNDEDELLNINRVSERLAKIYSRKVPSMLMHVSQQQFDNSKILKHQYYILEHLNKSKVQLSPKNKEQLMIKLNNILKAIIPRTMSLKSISKKSNNDDRNHQNFNSSVDDINQLQQLQKKNGQSNKKK